MAVARGSLQANSQSRSVCPRVDGAESAYMYLVNRVNCRSGCSRESTVNIDTDIIRPHRMHCIDNNLLRHTSHATWSVCLSVCMCVHLDVLCKNVCTDRDAVWGGGLTHVGPRNHVLARSQDRTNQFATARCDKSTAFAKLLWMDTCCCC